MPKIHFELILSLKTAKPLFIQTLLQVNSINLSHFYPMQQLFPSIQVNHKLLHTGLHSEDVHMWETCTIFTQQNLCGDFNAYRTASLDLCTIAARSLEEKLARTALIIRQINRWFALGTVKSDNNELPGAGAGTRTKRGANVVIIPRSERERMQSAVHFCDQDAEKST